MNKLSLLFTLMLLSCLQAAAEVTPTTSGAKITLDSVTTEVIVCSPTRVQVIKYVGTFEGSRPAAAQSELRRVTEKGKQKIDTGEYYVAINEKDGNVSFWDHDGNLIMAEQHRSSSFTPVGTDRYTVRQDFQVGRSGAQSLSSPGSDRNLIGTLAELGTDLPAPCVIADKGYAICWQSGLPGRMDDTPGRNVKKPGDVTFISDSTPAITYTFIYPATSETFTSFEY